MIGHEFFPDGIGLIYPRDAEITEDLASESPFFGVTPRVIRGFSGGGVFNLQNELVGIAIKDYILLDATKEDSRTYKIVKQGTIVTRINWAIHLLKKQSSQIRGFYPRPPRGRPDVLMAGLGTSGTLCGTGRFLRKRSQLCN